MYAIVLLAAVLGAPTYDDALTEHQETGKPLAVFCTATWCGPCRKMHGEMDRASNKDLVAYGEVDVDEQPEIASDLMNGDTVPQLIIKYRDENGRMQKLVYRGFRNTKQIEAIFHDAHIRSVHKSD